MPPSVASGSVVDPRTPVVVGVAQVLQRTDDLELAHGPVDLMARAVRDAVADAGAPVAAADELTVVRSLSTRDRNPAQSVARRAGIAADRHGLTAHGGNSPQRLVNDAATRIAAGELECVVLTGGEAARSRRRAKAAGADLAWMTADESDAPPLPAGDELALSHPAEVAARVVLPIEVYPMFEVALRAEEGLGVAAHRTRIAELWSRFSRVASHNPHAWSREALSAGQIAEPGPRNRMVGFPYTKSMNANNDVDMAAALVLCSAGRAVELGIPRDRWVFPVSGADCHEHQYVSHRWSFTRLPAVELGARAALRLAGLGTGDVGLVDLYSCFPAIVRLGAAAIGFDAAREPTVTGGLSFAGGPFNNYSMHAIATMVGLVREGRAPHGFVWANGGYATKHSFGVYAASPSPWRHASPQAEIDAMPARALATGADAAGDATVEAYTVVHGRDGRPARTIAAVRTPHGARAWATSEDEGLGAAMCEDEWVGRSVRVDDDGGLLA